jgi:hypothetical protein
MAAAIASVHFLTLHAVRDILPLCQDIVCTHQGGTMRSEDPPVALFVRVLEAAQRLGIGKTLLYAQFREGKFPHRTIGGRIGVSVKVIEQFAEPDERSLASWRSCLMNGGGFSKPNNSALILVFCV